MHILLKKIGISVVSVMVLLCANVASGAESGRSAHNTRASRSGARMPTMPTMMVQTFGDGSQSAPVTVAPSNPGTSDVPNSSDKPDTPSDKPDVPDNPNPGNTERPECPDGGVKNSAYTIDACMNDIYACVNNGGLANGINDMFNEDVRNSVTNGMGVCVAQVEKCVADVRVDCENVYRTTADVWMDFNARKVQPEYYNFVLRKTGLTPNQAEQTCLALAGGVKGNTGVYARWDAVRAECYIRVGAYNKDTPIKNSWLFGAAGDDKLAEAWLPTGTTFTCGKDLFGFSLYNNTSTVAVVGIGGGTLVGAGVGALAGHGARSFDCNNKDHRKKLAEVLRDGQKVTILNEFLENQITAYDEITVDQCNEIVAVHDKYMALKTAVSACNKSNNYEIEIVSTCKITAVADEATKMKRLEECAEKEREKICPGQTKEQCVDILIEKLAQELASNAGSGCLFKPFNLAIANGDGIYCSGQPGAGCLEARDIKPDIERFARVDSAILPVVSMKEKNNRAQTALIGAGIGAGAGGLATAITAFVEKGNINCRVGNNLEQVGSGKSHTIGTLRDYYVKLGLRLPDVVSVSSVVTDCASWHSACAGMSKKGQCNAVQINYKPAGAQAITMIYSACIQSGSQCIENYAVAKSYGACKNGVTTTQPQGRPVTLPDSVPVPAASNATQNGQPVAQPGQQNANNAPAEKQWYQTWNSPM